MSPMPKSPPSEAARSTQMLAALGCQFADKG
jgi:hypothetical protein